MSIIRFDDPWLKNGKVAEEIRQYLLASHGQAVGSATLTHTARLSGGTSIELIVELNDDHPHSDSVSDEIHDILIQARLDFVNNSLLRSLAWGFSSPAKTSKFRELLECKT